MRRKIETAQGCILNPILFALPMDEAIEVQNNTRGKKIRIDLRR